jgi:SnoaL-like domain
MSFRMGAQFNFRACVTLTLSKSRWSLQGGWPGAQCGWPAVLNQRLLSVAEISDRLEIQQLLVDYSTAIDLRRFDDLDTVFTPDAYIDP